MWEWQALSHQSNPALVYIDFMINADDVWIYPGQWCNGIKSSVFTCWTSTAHKTKISHELHDKYTYVPKIRKYASFRVSTFHTTAIKVKFALEWVYCRFYRRPINAVVSETQYYIWAYYKNDTLRRWKWDLARNSRSVYFTFIDARVHACVYRPTIKPIYTLCLKKTRH